MKNWLSKNWGMFKFLRGDTETFTGAILPTPEQLAEMPQLVGELVATTNPVVWKPLDLSKIPKYPIFSQNGSGSCVAMSIALIASILYYKRTNVLMMFSPSWIYKQRSNRPNAGMIGTDAFSIASKGLLPEVMMPSMDLTEAAINAVPTQPWFQKVAEVFAFEDIPVQLPTKDLETVASVMQTTGKPVNVWYEFLRSEWTSVPFVNGLFGTLLRHSVVAIDYGMYEGSKALAIQESWGVGATEFGAIRIVKENFHNSRNLFAAYPRRFKFEITDDKPQYTGTIISFQRCMKSIGFFPDDVPFVENWGPLTVVACKRFQAKYGLTQTGSIGPQTKAKLVELFP
jgi:peptidoglycan hydrolase-like protein with peptidoglycan-binding domain